MIASTGRGPADDASFALSFRTLSVSSCGGDEVQPKKVRRETKEFVGEILGENPKGKRFAGVRLGFRFSAC